MPGSCSAYANRRNKAHTTHVDLRQSLSHLAGAVALSLIPVVFIAFVSMPSSLHHHLGTLQYAANAP